jgi:hypothetical protein
MPEDKQAVKCFIAGLCSENSDPGMDRYHLSSSILIFAIPAYGILFRCRVEGDALEVEFAAFFSLLEFIKGNLSEQKIKAVEIMSSNPHFVFSFTGNSRQLAEGTPRRKLLEEYGRIFKIKIGHVDFLSNQALMPPDSYPSLPKESKITLARSEEEFSSPRFKPLMRGVKL